MNDRHMSTQFDAELSGISTRVLEMGGMVESQVARAVHALVNFSAEIASEVLATEERVNQTEVEIDLDLSTIIARRQPTARDLRLLIAISKTIANLERVGDEAARIARGIAIKPEVLLLDEPCSALDPISTGKIEELIHELKNDYTVVIVTHNMQQAARCSDYTAYMYLGDLIEFGPTSDLFMKPRKKDTEDYITGRFG